MPNTCILIMITLTVVFSSTALALFGLVQIYLAKYQHKSPFYWRRIPFISKLMLQIAHSKPIDLAMGVLRMGAVADFTIKQCLSALRHARVFMHLKNLFNELDELIDSSLPHDILARHNIKLGPELSPFLHQLLQHRRDEVNHFVQKKIVSEQELYSFGNLLAYKLHQQALLTIEYNAACLPEQKALIREKIAQENLEVAGCFRSLFVHLIKKDPRILVCISSEQSNELSYDLLKQIYPKSTKAGELLQILHDTPEFRYDLTQESHIRKISANYFLAQLEKSSPLTPVKNALQDLPQRTVNFYELPDEIRTVFLSVQQRFVDDAFAISRLAGWIYSLSWEFEYRVGFYIEKTGPRKQTIPTVTDV